MWRSDGPGGCSGCVVVEELKWAEYFCSAYCFSKSNNYSRQMRSRQRKTLKTQEETTVLPLSPHAYSNSRRPSQERQNSSRIKNHRESFTAQLVLPTLEQWQQLLRENKELRREIVELKVDQFYHFDDKKLKDLISEVEQLKKELKKTKSHFAELQMQNDFLTRSNAQLRAEIEREIHLRKREGLQAGRSAGKLPSCRSTDNTQNTDTSHHTEDELNNLSHAGHFQLHNTTLESALECRGTGREGEESLVEVGRREGKAVRRSMMEKILSPRRAKEVVAPLDAGNEYLLYRRPKEGKGGKLC